jgi:hypothetical protein
MTTSQLQARATAVLGAAVSSPPSRSVGWSGEAQATDGLSDPRDWPSAAQSLLTSLGFSLVNSQHPGAGGSHLLVAIRDEPTLRHFDPEALSYYAPRGPHAQLVTIDRESAIAIPSRRALWGHVHVTDRLRVENRFLTFGGEIRTALTDSATALIDIKSPAPIVRWGGHSQGCDSLAGEIGAFFGRLIVPVDFTPGIEERLATVPPELLYAAFLIDLARRTRTSELGTNFESPLDPWLTTERMSLRHRAPDAWAAGRALLVDLGLDRGAIPRR